MEWQDGSGYVYADDVNDSPIVYYGGGGGGGGGADGGDIQLGYIPAQKPVLSFLSAYIGPEYTPFDACKAEIISDGTELYYCVYGYGEPVKVNAADDESCTLYLGKGVLADVPRWMIRMEGDEVYSGWTGYISSDTAVYKDYSMRHELVSLSRNDEVTVLECFDGFYLVETEGQRAYVEHDYVSEEKVVYYYGGGGGGGGGEWTPPAL